MSILVPPISDAISAAGSFGDKGQQLIMNGVSNLPHGMSASPSEGVYRNYDANIGWISHAERWLTGSLQDGDVYKRQVLCLKKVFPCLCGSGRRAEGHMSSATTLNTYSHGIDAVSYTHLDVYKRQGYNSY